MGTIVGAVAGVVAAVAAAGMLFVWRSRHHRWTAEDGLAKPLVDTGSSSSGGPAVTAAEARDQRGQLGDGGGGHSHPTRANGGSANGGSANGGVLDVADEHDMGGQLK